MLFLDTEFNSHRGSLISLALVSDIDGHEFYGVLPPPANVHPWVAEHVMPLLDREPEPENVFRARLAIYLQRHSGEDIVADWPEDFMHLLDMITMPDGQRVNVDFDMRLVSGMDCKPDRPHNALSDARALMFAWKIKQAA
jgi:hypothetical protein